ncbi:protein of unknown function (plasmid) [Azospirillum lipoferum 4B]|uniref:Uncharacterized protein n=1 Tax=Azospirillum lipoferum (strain 4B) TaxID=862719 RepID=G7ZFU6_AZOL4|nr:protein of unknown function [Azospirillum lipoferum 4B]
MKNTPRLPILNRERLEIMTLWVRLIGGILVIIRVLRG